MNTPPRSIARQRSKLAHLVERRGTRSRGDHDAVERPRVIEELALLYVGGRRLDQPWYRGLDLRGADRTVTIRSAGTTLPVRAILDVEPVILFARQRKQSLVKSPLDCPQGLLTSLLFFGALLQLDAMRELLEGMSRQSGGQ